MASPATARAAARKIRAQIAALRRDRAEELRAIGEACKSASKGTSAALKRLRDAASALVKARRAELVAQKKAACGPGPAARKAKASAEAAAATALAEAEAAAMVITAAVTSAEDRGPAVEAALVEAEMPALIPVWRELAPHIEASGVEGAITVLVEYARTAPEDVVAAIERSGESVAAELEALSPEELAALPPGLPLEALASEGEYEAARGARLLQRYTAEIETTGRPGFRTSTLKILDASGATVAQVPKVSGLLPEEGLLRWGEVPRSSWRNAIDLAAKIAKDAPLLVDVGEPKKETRIDGAVAWRVPVGQGSIVLFRDTGQFGSAIWYSEQSGNLSLGSTKEEAIEEIRKIARRPLAWAPDWFKKAIQPQATSAEPAPPPPPPPPSLPPPPPVTPEKPSTIEGPKWESPPAAPVSGGVPTPTLDRLGIVVAPLPRDALISAYRNSSWNPERRAEEDQRSYLARIETMAATAAGRHDEARARELVLAFEQGYRARVLAVMAARGRVASSAIVGPSNFPTARNDKARNVERKRTEELLDYDRKFTASVVHEARTISADSGDAIGQLQAKLQELDERDRNLEAVKAVANDKSLSYESKKRRLMELGLSSVAADWGAQGGWARIQFSRQNLRQERKRIEERIEALQKEGARGEVEAETELPDGIHLRILDSPEKNRIQLFFSDRIGSELAARLKSRGWRWAPSEKAWQRQRTDNARSSVRELFGVDLGSAWQGTPPRAPAPPVELPPSLPEPPPPPPPAPPVELPRVEAARQKGRELAQRDPNLSHWQVLDEAKKLRYRNESPEEEAFDEGFFEARDEARKAWNLRSIPEMRALLEAAGYLPDAAAMLAEEGMGLEELKDRLKSSPGARGSLEVTHGLARRGPPAPPPPPPPVFRPAEGFRPAEEIGQVGALFEDIEPAPLVPALEALRLPIQWQGDFLEAYGIAPDLFFAIRGVAPARIGSAAAAYFDRAENDDDELNTQIREAASRGLVLLQVGQPASTVENEGDDSDDWNVFTNDYALENPSDIRDIQQNPAWILGWAELGEARGVFTLGAIRAVRALGKEEVRAAAARNIFFASRELAPAQVGADPWIRFPSAAGQLSGRLQRLAAGFGLEAYEVPMGDARQKAIKALLELQREEETSGEITPASRGWFAKELEEALKTTGKKLEDFAAPPADEDEAQPQEPAREEAPRESWASTIRPFAIDPSSLVLSFPRDRLELVMPRYRGMKEDAVVLWKTPHNVTTTEVTYQRDSRGRSVRQESQREVSGGLVLCQYVGRNPWLFWVPADGEEWIYLASAELPIVLAIAMQIPRIARTKEGLRDIAASPTWDRPESIKTEVQAGFVELVESARKSVSHVMPRSPVDPSAVVFTSTGEKVIQRDGSLRTLEVKALLCPPSISGKEGAEKPFLQLYSSDGQTLYFQTGFKVGFPMGYPKPLPHNLGVYLARATKDELDPLFRWLAEGYGMALCSLLIRVGDDFSRGDGDKILGRWTDFQDQVKMAMVPVMFREEDAKIHKERADKQEKAMRAPLVPVRPTFDDKDLHNDPLKYLKRSGGATGVSRVFFSGDTFTGKITLTSEDGTVRILDMGDKLTGEVRALPMAAIIRVLAAQPKEILWGLTQTNRVERSDFGPDFRADVSSIAVGFLNELRDQVMGPSNLFWSNRRVPELVEGLRPKNNKAGYHDGSLIHLPTGLAFMNVPNQKIAQVMLNELPMIYWEEADYEVYKKGKLHERRGELQATVKRLTQIDEDTRKVERILKASGSHIRPSLDVESLEDWSKRILSMDVRFRRGAERGLDSLISEARNPPPRKRGERRPTVAKKIQEMPVDEWIGAAVALLPLGNLLDAILDESMLALVNARNALGLLPDPGRVEAPAPAPSWKLGLSEEEYVRIAYEAGKAERLSGRAPRSWRKIQEEQGIPTGPHYRAAEAAYERAMRERTSNPSAGSLEDKCKAAREEIRALELDQRALLDRLVQIKRHELTNAKIGACEAPRAAVRAKYDDQIERLTRQAAQLDAQAREWEAKGKEKDRAKLPPLAKGTSDQLIEATLGNLEPRLLPLWRELAPSIEGSASVRLEVFLDYVREHPEDATRAQKADPALASLPPVHLPPSAAAPGGPAKPRRKPRAAPGASGSAASIVAALRANAEAYHAGTVNHAGFSAEQSRIWAGVPAALHDEVLALLRETAPPALPGPREASPAPASGRPALTAARVLEVARGTRQSVKDLVYVADVMRPLLAEGYPLAEVRAAVLAADREGLWQLTADTGIGRFSREDLAMLPPGPRGMHLTSAHILKPSRTSNPEETIMEPRMWIEDNKIKVEGPFSLDFQGKALAFGGRWNATARHWTFPRSEEAGARAAFKSVYGKRTKNPAGWPGVDEEDVVLSKETIVRHLSNAGRLSASDAAQLAPFFALWFGNYLDRHQGGSGVRVLYASRGPDQVPPYGVISLIEPSVPAFLRAYRDDPEVFDPADDLSRTSNPCGCSGEG